MSRKSFTPLLVVILLAVVPTVLAQSDTPINYGDMLEGTITDTGTPVTFSFEAQRGDFISITALADDLGELNLALDLINPAGDTVASNDDYHLQNPALLELPLPGESGTYQIAVRAESGTGGFLLILEGETNLAPGDVIFEETFDNNDLDWETNTEDDAVLFSDIVDGEYVIQYETTEVDYYWVVAPGFTNWAFAPIFETPYQVTVDVSGVESSSDSYSVMVLFQVQAEYECYDMVFFNPDGSWIFYNCSYAMAGGGSFATPVDFRDGETHTVGVQVDDYRLTVLLDDQMASLAISGLENQTGSVGFGIHLGTDQEIPEGEARTAEAHFDNMIVRIME